MIPAAHELQYAPASAARSQFLHLNQSQGEACIYVG